MTWHFLLNVGSIVALLVIVVTWMATVTLAFSEIGTLWALAGLAAWLAFFKQLIPEARIRKIRGSFTDRVLDHPRTWWFVLGALLLFLFVTSFVGVLEIQNGAGPGRKVLVYDPNEESLEDETKDVIIPGQPLRRLCWVSWGGRSWNVKAEGLPVGEVEVYPWWLSSGSEKYIVPWSFTKPVVLIAPGVAVASVVKPDVAKPDAVTPDEDLYTLEVTIEDPNSEGVPPVYTTREQPYLGGLIWVGCDDTDIALPDELASRRGWDEVLNQSEVLNRPAQVIVPLGEDVEKVPPKLKPGQRITARIKHKNLIVYRSDLLIVAKERPDGSFVQALLIDRKD